MMYAMEKQVKQYCWVECSKKEREENQEVVRNASEVGSEVGLLYGMRGCWTGGNDEEKL